METQWTWLKSAVPIIILGALYYAASWVGLHFSFEGSNASPVCPAAGLAFAGLLLLRVRAWPGVWLGAFSVNAIEFFRTAAAPPWTILWVSALIALGSTIAVLTGWVVCHHWSERTSVNSCHVLLCPGVNIFRLSALALLIGVVGACIASTAICMAGIEPWSRYSLVWMIWCLGNASGVLLLTPFLLVWAPPVKLYRLPSFWAEVTAAFALLALTCWVVHENFFGGQPFPYLMIAPFVWIAVRLGPKALATGIALVSTWTLWETAQGHGPFPEPSQLTSILHLLAFLWVTGITSMALVGTVTALQKLTAELEQRVRVRTAELRESNEALQGSERRERHRAAELATLLEAVPTPVLIAHDSECTHMTGNRAANDLLRIPGGAEASITAPTERRPRHFKPIKNGCDLRAEELPAQMAARGIPVQNFEFSIVFDDGPTRHLLGYGTPLRDEEGRPRGAVHVLIDITERIRAEQKLKEALVKEVMLRREIHHRVKNNLQVIISLLYLQSARISDPQTLEILRESQVRTRSIAIIYEMLSQSDNLIKIEAAGYVRQLTANLLSAYQVNPGTVALAIHAEGISFGLDQAIPCGLIINELVSNVFKHAFPDGREGELVIDLRRAGTNLVKLTVRDNGVCLPEGFDAANARSMGLGLVRDLTRQLEGSVEFHRDHGTVVTITFPDLKPSEIT